MISTYFTQKCGNRNWNAELMWVSAGPVPYYEGNKASNSSFENKHISKPLHVITSTTNESYLLILDLYKKRGQTQMIRLHAVKQFLSIRTAL
jgi:hypothetical protein